MAVAHDDIDITNNWNPQSDATDTKALNNVFHFCRNDGCLLAFSHCWGYWGRCAGWNYLDGWDGWDSCRLG